MKEISQDQNVNSQYYWNNKKVVVTGGSGFLGTHVIEKLTKYDLREIFIPRSSKYDLRKHEACLDAFSGADIVIHLAARVGGIGYNKENPVKLFEDNILMGVNSLRAAREAEVKKFVAVGTICSYPKFTQVPFKEEDLWNGYPEETNAPYGMAKKMLIVQAAACRQQYGFNAINILPVNLYGPNDNFSPDSSHVIPALIKKFVDAKAQSEGSVSVWGTGRATREFLYVKDAARGIILASERYNRSEPVNLGAGFEISIRDLAVKVSEIVGFDGGIIFDTTKPDGQQRRMLDTSKAKEEFGFEALYNFDTGLKETVGWYLSSRCAS